MGGVMGGIVGCQRSWSIWPSLKEVLWDNFGKLLKIMEFSIQVGWDRVKGLFAELLNGLKRSDVKGAGGYKSFSIHIFSHLPLYMRLLIGKVYSDNTLDLSILINMESYHTEHFTTLSSYNNYLLQRWDSWDCDCDCVCTIFTRMAPQTYWL